MYGDGPDKEKIKNIVQKNKKLNNEIRFLGKINYLEMKEVYNKANILVMPSIRETTGSVILEAMAQNIPVIAMKKYGAAILLNNECAWLYDGETEESILESLAVAIKESIEKSELTIEKGKIGNIKAKEFLFENKVKHYNEIYRRLLKM